MLTFRWTFDFIRHSKYVSNRQTNTDNRQIMITDRQITDNYTDYTKTLDNLKIKKHF